MRTSGFDKEALLLEGGVAKTTSNRQETRRYLDMTRLREMTAEELERQQRETPQAAVA